MLTTLRLPQLPSEIKTKARLLSNQLAHNDSSRQWLNDFHGGTVSAVNHTYDLIPTLDQEIKNLYSEYFNEPIIPMIGVQRNVGKVLGCTPPHCDRARNLAINYYIDLGGENVTTNFYNYQRTDSDRTAAENLRYDQVELVESHQLTTDTWYAFNVQQCHSVENIETLRIFIGIIVESNPDFTKFIEEYKMYVD